MNYTGGFVNQIIKKFWPNQWMEFHETYSYNISGNGMFLHIKACHSEELMSFDCLHFNELVPTGLKLGKE